ncbi:hypothetical protein C8Q77DRAFT_1049373 [Trametes polyzona]|nr:hypothetical protein C8Q77DRAFT_1049373 [Trametes polyzona]
MPSSMRYRRQSAPGSPPLSTIAYSTSHATTVGQQKLNVVTRLAIEGRAERGADGAAIKVYLKISLPLDSITPGASIPLFPEENLKILDQQVHPLDANSAPYNFSSVTSPLLHKAARALNLPARSSQTYVPMSASVVSSDSIPPLEDKYTGTILVSAYHISYILPKEFPRRATDSRGRRPSSPVAQYMAAIDLWVPFLTQPPNAPFLLAIPTPRCLSNHIKLRIFPPTNSKTSSSMASLSSADEDAGTWDMMSDPHVTRNSSARLARSHSYNNFADDESSDASTSAGFSDGCGIQGSFPSTDRIRIRWARPMKPEQLPQTVDGRRRVGIKEVKGTMTCSVLGVSRDQEYGAPEGVVMRLQYEATCKGVWFPGVATLLGLDAGLDSGDCDVTWVPGLERKWTISGDVGFTGYAIGPPPTPPLSRQSSVDNPSIYVLPSSPDARGIANGHLPPARHDSSSSTSSLLRAPLPAQNVADYSFENSPASTPISSLASLPLPSSPENDRRSRASSFNGRYTDLDTDYEEEDAARPPKVPITIHLNMNDLLPPAKQDFKFRITGTVLVTPRKPVLTHASQRYRPSPNGSQPSSDGETDPDVLVVPRFRVLCAEREHISCTIQNDVNDATLDVYNSSGDVRHAQTRKTVLQRGGQVKCGTDGARIALRPIQRSPSPPSRGRGRTEDSVEVSRLSRSRPRTPNGVSRRDRSPSFLRHSMFTSTMRTPVRRDGPLLIPSVKITLTPFPKMNMVGPPDYAVRVNLPAPTDTDMEWLEFGLALPSVDVSGAAATSSPGEAPKVEIASASIEGVPVRFVTHAVAKPEMNGGVPFGEASSKEWITWVKVHIGDVCGGKVKIIYLVKGQQVPVPEKAKGKEKEKALAPITLNALLPSFPLPVGALEVNVRVKRGFEIASVKTNLSHEQSVPQGHQFLHYALEEYFYPRLVVDLTSTSQDPAHAHTHAASPRPAWGWAQILVTLISVVISVLLILDRIQHPLPPSDISRVAPESSPDPHVIPTQYERLTETITVTATVSAPTTVTPVRWYPSASESPALSFESTPSAAADQRERAASSASRSASRATSTVLPTLSSTPLPPPGAEGAERSIVEYLSNVWTLVFEVLKIEFPEVHPLKAANETMHRVHDSLASAYHVFRTAYNWPLPPQ